MRARGIAGLVRLPVTEEIAGSNPVGPATNKVHHLVDFFRASSIVFELARSSGQSELRAPVRSYNSRAEASFEYELQ